MQTRERETVQLKKDSNLPARRVYFLRMRRSVSGPVVNTCDVNDDDTSMVFRPFDLLL